jgi:predicted metal-dependent phosphoesterase TrpH
MLAYDLHVHSEFSHDSFLKIPRILQMAKKEKLDGIAVTDHGTIRGGLTAQKLARKEGFAVICGAEFYTDCGHIIGLFLTDEIREHDSLTVTDLIKRQGGISILAHPFQKTTRLNNDLLRRIDGVESWNSRTRQMRNLQATGAARKFNLAEVGGSDAHFAFEIARGVTLTKHYDLRKAILHHETVAGGTCSGRFVHLMSFTAQMAKTRTLRSMFEAATSYTSRKLNTIVATYQK